MEDDRHLKHHQAKYEANPQQAGQTLSSCTAFGGGAAAAAGSRRLDLRREGTRDSGGTAAPAFEDHDGGRVASVAAAAVAAVVVGATVVNL